jgi:hypothetical protein
MKQMIKRLVNWDGMSPTEQNIFRYKLSSAPATLLGLLPIPLWRVLMKYRTDKHGPGQHLYGHTYGELFRNRKYKAIKLLEIGIGGYDSDIGGRSLLAWKEYFPFGCIVACDIEPKFFLAARRIKIYQTDQSSKSDLEKLREEQAPFDIIIDDGSHLSPHQIFTFSEMFGSLRQGGLYVIEDVQTSFWPSTVLGRQWHGAHIDQPEFGTTCFGYFLELTKYLNHNEFVATRGVNSDLLATARQIRRISFERNLIIVEKGPNDLPSSAEEGISPAQRSRADASPCEASPLDLRIACSPAPPYQSSPFRQAQLPHPLRK